MIWPFGVVAYALVALPLWRTFAGAAAWSGLEETPEAEPDWGLGFWIGLIGAAFWPLVLAAIAVVELGVSWPLVIGSERKRRRFERERAYREALRELGLGE